MPDRFRREARAFAPSHVTGLFAPALEARDPRGRGSVGAGLVLDTGVTASVRWEPGGRRRLRLTSSASSALPISEEVARRLLGDRDGSLSVRLEHALPIGQGFGASAAGALATALAVAAAVGEPRHRAVDIAHLADLYGRGGLGGVAAILGGGLELRLRAGVPPFGRVERHPAELPLVAGVVGRPIPSAKLLGREAGPARFELGRELLERLRRSPDLESFWAVSEEFGRSVGLASPRLTRVLDSLRRQGVPAVQAMFGQSFLAPKPPGPAGSRVVRSLRAARVTLWEIGVGRSGARLLPDGRAPG